MIRLMTHNQWKHDDNASAWAEMGMDCSSTVRSRGFVRVFKETMPDIIGCQETSFKMADELIRFCAEEGMRYAILWGRDTPIFYRPDKFELLDSDFSLYPDAFPGHEGIYNNKMTKSWNIGVFRVKENGHIFVFASTHLWWKSSNPESSNYQPMSDEAREYQLAMLLDRIEIFRGKYNCPAVVVGDMNANYNSLAIRYALSHGYQHAHDIAVEYVDETNGHHFCSPRGFATSYGDRLFIHAIDHILLKDAPDGAVRRFERYSPEYYLPLSDHSPAFIDIDI